MSCSSVRGSSGIAEEHVARGADLSTCRGRVRRAPREPRPATGARDRGLCGWGHIDPDHPLLRGRALVLTSDRGVDAAREPTPRHCGRRLPRQAAAVHGRRDHRRPSRARAPQDPLRSRPAHVRHASRGGTRRRAVPDHVTVPRRRRRRGQPAEARRGRRPRAARRGPAAQRSPPRRASLQALRDSAAW